MKQFYLINSLNLIDDQSVIKKHYKTLHGEWWADHDDAPGFCISDVDRRSILQDQHHRVLSLIPLPITAHYRRPAGVQLSNLRVEQTS